MNKNEPVQESFSPIAIGVMPFAFNAFTSVSVLRKLPADSRCLLARKVFIVVNDFDVVAVRQCVYVLSKL